MSNPVGSTKVNGTPQIPQTSLPDPPPQKTPASGEKQEAQVPALSEEAKSSMKTLHHFDGTAKEAKLRASMNPLADPCNGSVLGNSESSACNAGTHATGW